MKMHVTWNLGCANQHEAAFRDHVKATLEVMWSDNP